MWEFSFWHWLILAGVLITLEIAIPVTYFLWMGIAAVLVGAITWLLGGLDLTWQLFLFVTFSLTSVILWKLYYKHYPQTTDQPLLNERTQQYVGRVFTLKQPIVDGFGKIKVDDSNWKITGPDCASGTKVRVIGVVHSTILKIEIISR